MSTTIWIGDKMYVVDEPVRDHVDQLQAELTTAKEANKRLRDEIRARRQWQACPKCNKIFATQS